MLQKNYIRIWFLLFCLLIIFFILAWNANITNPYSKHTEMTPAYTAILGKDDQLVLQKRHPISFIDNPFAILIVKLQSAIRILENAWFSGSTIKGDEQNIIDAIHKERFDPTKAYIISGDHFADFYPRNYGLFYQAALDQRIQGTYLDWENRQKMILQTTALYLEILSQSKRTYPAYMPLTNASLVGVDIWAYPSDSLYSILFQLSALTDSQYISSLFPVKNISQTAYPLQTQKAGKQLLEKYKTVLKRHVLAYEAFVLDPRTHLVKKDIYLSGVRDGMKRQSSFYDNVIVWATVKLASDLGILHISDTNLITWKQKIIDTFWDKKHGVFLDDLSKESTVNHIFPGDAFIIAQTQFLNPKDAQDREKILAMIAYVKKNKLDQPFPIPWSPYDQPDKYYSVDRYMVPSYMGHTIFSHWSIEYIKELILVSDGNKETIRDAKDYLHKYKKNIEKYGGYPEIYSANGNLYKTPFYTAILHTGWVIDYEQAKIMLDQL